MTMALLQTVCEGAVSTQPSDSVRSRLAAVADWDSSLKVLAYHGLLPATHRVVRLHDVPCAPKVRRHLAAAFLRGVARARAQEQALAELVRGLLDAGIDHLVLKGAAIARLAYPEVALRPMDDLDILVAPDQGRAAREVLLALGYSAPLPTTRFERLQHQQPTAQRYTDGELLCVEIHHTLFNLVVGEHIDMSLLPRPFAQFDLAGIPIRHLGIEGLLWMQHRGLRKLAEPLRAIHLLDLALLAQRLPEAAPGPSLRCRRPRLWFGLLALDEWLPLGRAARQYLGFPPRRSGIQTENPGEDYRGWPRPRQGSWLAWLRQSLWPPLWWGRFLHGIPPGTMARPALQWRHAAFAVDQTARRIYLGPVKPGAFFSGIRLPPTDASEELAPGPATAERVEASPAEQGPIRSAVPR